MNRYRFWTLLWVNAVCLVCQAQTWQQASPKDSGFSVQMPGKPQEKKVTRDTEYGKATVYTHITRHEVIVYQAGYYLPASLEIILPTKIILDGFQTGLLSRGGKILGERDIKIMGYPGRALSFNNAGMIYRMRSVYANRRLYFVMASVYEEDAASNAANIEKMFASFRLLDLPPTPPVEWKKISASKREFSVLMPGIPQSTIEEGDFDESPMMTFSSYDDTSAYTVLYADFYKGQVSGDLKKSLQFFQQGIMKGIKGTTLLSIKDVILNQWPGMEIQFVDKIGLMHQMRFYALENRCFVIGVKVAPENKDKIVEQTKKFFDSFEPTGNENPQEAPEPKNS